MRRFTLIIPFFFLVLIDVRAQYEMTICDTPFTLAVDDRTMTAQIIDNAYLIDDRPFAVTNKTRKIKGFTQGETRIIDVPDSYTANNGKTYTITSVGRAAFAGYSNIEYVNIPPTVTNIGEFAFFGSSVKGIKVPESVVTVGHRAFGRCLKLETLMLPTTMQQAQTKTLYAESKHCTVTYYQPVLAGKIVNPDDVEQAIQSDVDLDIPVTNRRAEGTFAIIIANENYKQEPKVPSALHDGGTFKEYCQKVLGIPNDNIQFLQDATRNEMLSAVDWVTEIAKVYKQDARVIFYYSGHGIPDEKENTPYLLPVDARGKNLRMSYKLSDLYADLGQLEVRDVTVFLDACFSGSDRGSGSVGGETRSVAIKAKTEEALGNMVVFSAAQGSETAWPYAEKAHGLFTYYLLKALKESKGNMTYGELGDYLTKEVSRRSIVVNKKSQTPCITPSPALSAFWQKMTFFK